MNGLRLLNALAFAAIFSLAAKPADACSCNRESVEEAYGNAEIVFEGKVISIDGTTTYGQWPAGTVKFKIFRIWKGNVRSDFIMPAVLEGSGCLGFYPHHLKTGNELLVYANLVSWTPAGEKAYFTNACARTSLLRDAKQDLSALPSISKQPVPKTPRK